MFLAIMGETCQVCLLEIKLLALSTSVHCAAMADLEHFPFFASPVCWHHLTQQRDHTVAIAVEQSDQLLISCAFPSGLGTQ